MGVQATKIPTRTFAQKLRAEIRQRDEPKGSFGLRTIARLIHEQQKARGQEPRPVESLRRQLRTYVQESSPAAPRAANRHEVEDALGLERDSLKDDEEADRPMRLTFPVTVEVPLEAIAEHLLARAAEANREPAPEQGS